MDRKIFLSDSSSGFFKISNKIRKIKTIISKNDEKSRDKNRENKK